ncbi:tRNA lysidine(34) synthetase TilS [candidate division KSB1 bacterium]|nr:tRNA lysidine(34) synthetase TilS [candidate division KSB1 bacterium]
MARFSKKTKGESDFAWRVQSFCRRHDLFARGARVLVAVSGGVDSVVLLHVLKQLGVDADWHLIAAHLDHGIRGAESAQDAEFVRDLTLCRQVELVEEKADVPAYCREKGLGIEAGARAVRLDFLYRIADEQRCDVIALGHHADDQAETVLLNLLRGSGVRGLKGMRPRRGKIVRPLLFARRQEIEAYAAENDLNFCIDASNRDLSFRRNRIRHELLPSLTRDYNPNLVRVLARTAELFGDLDAYLVQSGYSAFRSCCLVRDGEKIVLDIDRFLAYFDILQNYILAAAFHALTGHRLQLSGAELDQLRRMLHKRQSHKCLRLRNGLLLHAEASHLLIDRADSKSIDPITLDGPGAIRFGSAFILEIMTDAPSFQRIRNNTDRRREWIDAEKITWPLCIRSVAAGDRFFPVNLGGSKSVADFFIDAKVPYHRRRKVPLVFSGNRLVWIAGYRLDERFKVAESTQKILRLELRKAGEQSI